MLAAHLFARDDIMPSWWANSIQRGLSTGAPSFEVNKATSTSITVIAGANDAAAVIAIAGKWRWNETTVTRAHPGGAAGSYNIFVTGTADKIDSTPAPGTDNTTYSFALAILKAGETPTIVAGVVDIFRNVGSLQWSGTEITRIDQTVNKTPLHAHKHSTAGVDPLAPADIEAATAAQATALNIAYPDFSFRRGIFSFSEWVFTATINPATGELGSVAATGGTAKIRNQRSVTPNAVLSGLKPPTLPASGKFISVGVYINEPTVFGAPATVSLLSGVEKTTEAEALAAPSAFLATACRIKDIIIKNTAGVYSIVAERDRREWARSFRWKNKNNLVTTISTTAPTLLFTAVRGEIQLEAIVTVVLMVTAETANDVLTLGVRINGALNSGTERPFVIPVAGKSTTITYICNVPVGTGTSNLFEVVGSIGAEGVGHKFTLPTGSNELSLFEITEPVNSGFNNGTS